MEKNMITLHLKKIVNKMECLFDSLVLTHLLKMEKPKEKFAPSITSSVPFLHMLPYLQTCGIMHYKWPPTSTISFQIKSFPYNLPQKYSTKKIRLTLIFEFSDVFVILSSLPPLDISYKHDQHFVYSWDIHQIIEDTNVTSYLAAKYLFLGMLSLKKIHFLLPIPLLLQRLVIIFWIMTHPSSHLIYIPLPPKIICLLLHLQIQHSHTQIPHPPHTRHPHQIPHLHTHTIKSHLTYCPPHLLLHHLPTNPNTIILIQSQHHHRKSHLTPPK
jgi:hypothetical protein